jgi:enoyl-CoA hydratase
MSISVEKMGAVHTVILDRAEVRNAVDAATARGLAEAFRAFEADKSANVAVLWGANGAFCAGADLKALAAGEDEARLNSETEGPMGPTRMWLEKPVIAAVAGYAVAGGFELALWCDLRVMEEDATFGVFNRRFGIPYIDGGTVWLPRLVGLGRALDILLTGRPVGAEEALAIGLVNRVVPTGQARAAAEALAQEIAAFPQGSLRTDRRSAYEEGGLSLAEAMANELEIARPLIGAAQSGASQFATGHGRGGASVAGGEGAASSAGAPRRE